MKWADDLQELRYRDLFSMTVVLSVSGFYLFVFCLLVCVCLFVCSFFKCCETPVAGCVDVCLVIYLVGSVCLLTNKQAAVRIHLAHIHNTHTHTHTHMYKITCTLHIA